MNTSQYSKKQRREIKRIQRTNTYREMQVAGAGERSKLEATLRERNERIAKLEEALRGVLVSGVPVPINFGDLGISIGS